MDINSRLDFAADPTAVYSMMTSRAWLEGLVAQTGATSHEIQIGPDTTVVDMTLPAPAPVAKFAGSILTTRQKVTWQPAAADGSRDGSLVVEVPGMPVTMNGRAHMAPGGRGTVVTYTGTLKVNIPIMGRQLENQAGPYVKQVIDAQQEAGDQWLAQHA